ncbi:MAG: peroxidase-related enzyme [Woeseiaceae bacterium]|nr:peroxidase-related enzyme [Woeseiaceae bacterium]
MSWIDEIAAEEAEGKLAETYAELERKRGKISNILKVHSLSPDALGNHLDLYMTLMFARSGLSRMEREAVAVVVSANNECDYCVNHHAESLRRYVDDEDTMNMLMTADGLETLEPRLSNIVRHAEKLTTAPGAMTESDLGELRAVGLSDKDILDLTLVTSYFNFVNRIALGLGVTFSAEEMSGYIDEGD